MRPTVPSRISGTVDLSAVLACSDSPIRCFFFFNDTATTEIYTLSLHDALPICMDNFIADANWVGFVRGFVKQCQSFDLTCMNDRSEEHTSELQSPCNLVCRLLLEKKKTKIIEHQISVQRQIS